MRGLLVGDLWVDDFGGRALVVGALLRRSAACVFGYCRHLAGRVRDRIVRRWQLGLAFGSVAGAARPGYGPVRIGRRWQLRLALGSVAGSPAPGWYTFGSSTASDHRIVGWTVAVAVVDWSPSWLTR